MPQANTVAQLLVEGKNDQHVVWALCQKHNIPQVFTVEVPSESGGIDPLLESIPVRLKIARLRALGIVIDADTDLDARWMSVRDRLIQSGYEKIPKILDATGMILHEEGKPDIGVWVMPNNSLPGMLEDFLAYLIPENDPLAKTADSVLDDIEQQSIANYSSVHRPKAFIHTWLAWQETPGQPMGQAITANALQGHADLALVFVSWLHKLFVKEND